MSAEDVVRALVAHLRWRWVPGLRVWLQSPAGAHGTVTGYTSRRCDHLDVAWDGGTLDRTVPPVVLLPDLTEAATQGCLARMYVDEVNCRGVGRLTINQLDEIRRRLGAALCDRDGVLLAEMLLELWSAPA